MEQLREREQLDFKELILRGAFCLLIPLSTVFYGMLNKNRGKIYILQTSIDKAIPFNQYFIILYIFWYLYIAGFLIYFCILDKNSYYKLLFSIVAGELLSCVIFYFFPTYVPRPYITGNDFCSKLVLLIYKSDNPYNAFPSIHVIDSVLVAVFVYLSGRVKNVYKALSFICAFLIIISTMFVKQHYFPDIISGIIVALGICIFIIPLNFNKKTKGNISF